MLFMIVSIMIIYTINLVISSLQVGTTCNCDYNFFVKYINTYTFKKLQLQYKNKITTYKQHYFMLFIINYMFQ